MLGFCKRKSFLLFFLFFSYAKISLRMEEDRNICSRLLYTFEILSYFWQPTSLIVSSLFAIKVLFHFFLTTIILDQLQANQSVFFLLEIAKHFFFFFIPIRFFLYRIIIIVIIIITIDFIVVVVLSKAFCQEITVVVCFHSPGQRMRI